MKCVLLAGGFGTRISEESHLKPKPMLEIGGQPILWHIMKMYSSFGSEDTKRRINVDFPQPASAVTTANNCLSAT